MSLDFVLKKSINIVFLVLVFFTPLLLIPLNYELFEFNKMIFVYLATIIISFLWLARMIIARKLIWQKTPFDIFIFIFLISQLISTVGSHDIHTSIWGYYSRFHGGLLSTISYVILFWAFINNTYASLAANKGKKPVPKIIYFALLSGTLVTGFGILERFGIDKNVWVQDVQNRVFSTIGQPNWLAAYINALIFIPLVFLFKYKNWQKYLFAGIYFAFYLCLVFTKSKSGLAAFWVVLPIFYLLLYLTKKPKKIILVSIINILLFFGLTAVFYPQLIGKIKKTLPLTNKTYTGTPSNVQVTASGKEIRIYGSPTSQIRQVVWQGAINIWQKYPIFGFGNETFAYAYYLHRSVEHNQNSEWDFLYNKAHNEYLNYLANNGFVGLVAVLALQLAWPIWLFYKKSKKRLFCTVAFSLVVLLAALNPGHIFDQIFSRIWFYPRIVPPLALAFLLAIALVVSFYYFYEKWIDPDLGKKNSAKYLNIGLLSGFISIVFTNFYGFSVVVIGLFSFLLPAISYVYSKNLSKHAKITSKYKKISQLSRFQQTLLIALFFSAIMLIYKISQIWEADRLYAQGKSMHQSGQYLAAFENLTLAEQKNPSEPVIIAQLGENASMLAYLYHSQDATGASQMIKDLSALSLERGQKAIRISPFNINHYKTLAKIYLNLSRIDPAQTANAINTLEDASRLSPTDPKLLVNTALLYKNIDKPDKAAKLLQKAIELKPNYDHAYVYLARIYISEKKDSLAAETYQNLLNNNYPPNQEAIEYLEKYPKTINY